MKRITLFLTSILLAAFFSGVSAKVINGYGPDKTKSTGLITFNITSVDYRDDLTRIKGTLVGRPHTSNRIDELILITPSGKQYNATDIEGVDMKRYFQWEDNGNIDIEIDFAPMKTLKRFTVKATGPNGESQSEILLKTKKKRKASSK